MSEEPAAVIAPEAPASETPTMFNAEGGFTENWTQSLTDTALHDNPTLKSTKSVESLANQLVNAQKITGMDKDRMLVAPNEASSEEEWAAFHKAGGRPETADDYAFAKPEELSEEYYSPEQAKAAQELMHQLGLSKKQADSLFAFNNNFVIAELAKKTQDAELEATKLQDGLYADWGNAFEQKKHLGNKAIEEGTAGNVEFKTRLTEKFGNDPDFIRFTANLGGKFSEGGSPNIPLIPTTGDIQNQIDEAMAHKSHGADYKAHGFTKAQHESQVEKVSQLYKSMYPEKR